MAHDHFYGICENKCLVEIEHEKIPGVVPIEKGGTGATNADEAVANLQPCVIGRYVGDGEEEQVITLPFEPKAIFVCLRNYPLTRYSAVYEYTICNSGFACSEGLFGATITMNFSTMGISLSGNELHVQQSQEASNEMFINLNKYLSHYMYVAFK